MKDGTEDAGGLLKPPLLGAGSPCGSPVGRVPSAGTGEVGEGIGCEPSVGGGPLAGGIEEEEALGGEGMYGKSVGAEPPGADCEGGAGGRWKENKNINFARLDMITHLLRTSGCRGRSSRWWTK